MRTIYSAMLTLLALCFAGCHANTKPVGCSIEGPAHLIPEKVRRIQLGMSKAALEHLLGEADYSPSEGQFYFSTGGDCPLEDTDRLAACGIVAEFRDYRNGSDAVLTESLQSCRWGGIGE
jgi:hypothetical protein